MAAGTLVSNEPRDNYPLRSTSKSLAYNTNLGAYSTRTKKDNYEHFYMYNLAGKEVLEHVCMRRKRSTPLIFDTI